jgi:hypothetical protein
MTRTGTCHFLSRRSAQRYYAEPGGTWATAREIERKIAAGEIKVGPPAIKPGQRLTLVDAGTRYAIVEGEA